MESKSIYTHWCYACVHHASDIPEELSGTASQLSREYKHIVYCRRLNTLIVANDDMWIDKTDPAVGCSDFRSV